MSEEEAWTEEYFKKQDCGTVVGEPPIYQWILEVTGYTGEVKTIGTFCREGYAKLYKKWILDKYPYTECYITKTKNNPPRDDIEVIMSNE